MGFHPYLRKYVLLPLAYGLLPRGGGPGFQRSLWLIKRQPINLAPCPGYAGPLGLFGASNPAPPEGELGLDAWGPPRGGVGA